MAALPRACSTFDGSSGQRQRGECRPCCDCGGQLARRSSRASGHPRACCRQPAARRPLQQLQQAQQPLRSHGHGGACVVQPALAHLETAVQAVEGAVERAAVAGRGSCRPLAAAQGTPRCGACRKRHARRRTVHAALQEGRDRRLATQRSGGRQSPARQQRRQAARAPRCCKHVLSAPWHLVLSSDGAAGRPALVWLCPRQRAAARVHHTTCSHMACAACWSCRPRLSNKHICCADTSLISACSTCHAPLQH